MERHILRRKLFIIAFELTTPLVSLSGFHDLAKRKIRSQEVSWQLEIMQEATEHIKRKKDLLTEKISAENDPDFASEKTAVSFLKGFASELQIHEHTIIAAINQLLKYDFETGDPSLDEWAKSISTNAAENLHLKLEALRTIKPDLELVIPESGR